MPELYISPDHPSEQFFTDDYVVIAWSGNTQFGDTITEDQFFAARHATVMFESHTPSYEAWFIQNKDGRERDIAIVVGSFSALPFMIEGTDYLALMHRSMADIFARQMPLRLLPVRSTFHRWSRASSGTPIPTATNASPGCAKRSTNRRAVWLSARWIRRIKSIYFTASSGPATVAR